MGKAKLIIGSFFSAQFLKFLFVGVTAAAANWLSRFGFDIFMSYGAAVLAAYGVGTTTAFILNAIYVFPGSDRPVTLQARDFFAINIAFLPLVWAVALLFRGWLLALGFGTYAPALAHIIALAAPMLLSFLFYKFVAFRRSDD